MKVICIDAKNYLTGRENKGIKEGNIYEPSGEQVNADGTDCYIIPNGIPTTCTYSRVNIGVPLYRKSRFIPLSTIDEMELLEQRQDALQSL